MAIPGIETLSDQAKKWLAHAIAGMAVADGEVDSSELAHLREAIKFLDEKGEIEQLMAEVREHHVADLSPQKVEFAEMPAQLPTNELRETHEQLNVVISQFSKMSQGYRKSGREGFMPTDTHKGLSAVASLLKLASCAELPSR